MAIVISKERRRFLPSPEGRRVSTPQRFMNAMAIGHAELYIYPEKVAPHDRISSAQRVDVTSTQELLEVLTSMPAETSFSVLLVINDCVVGNGKYFMTHETVTILHEYGACIGFLVKPLAILREARQEHQQRYNKQDHVQE